MISSGIVVVLWNLEASRDQRREGSLGANVPTISHDNGVHPGVTIRTLCLLTILRKQRKSAAMTTMPTKLMSDIRYRDPMKSIWIVQRFRKSSILIVLNNHKFSFLCKNKISFCILLVCIFFYKKYFIFIQRFIFVGFWNVCNWVVCTWHETAKTF